MAQDRIPYDAAAATAAANNLAAMANMDQGGYWVAGPDSSVEGSRAKPEIWTNASDYAEKIAALASATASAPTGRITIPPFPTPPMPGPTDGTSLI